MIIRNDNLFNFIINSCFMFMFGVCIRNIIDNIYMIFKSKKFEYMDRFKTELISHLIEDEHFINYFNNFIEKENKKTEDILKYILEARPIVIEIGNKKLGNKFNNFIKFLKHQKIYDKQINDIVLMAWQQLVNKKSNNMGGK